MNYYFYFSFKIIQKIILIFMRFLFLLFFCIFFFFLFKIRQNSQKHFSLIFVSLIFFFNLEIAKIPNFSFPYFFLRFLFSTSIFLSFRNRQNACGRRQRGGCAGLCPAAPNRHGQFLLQLGGPIPK